MHERTSRREWSRRVGRWRRSGKTSKEFAAETGVNARTLLWWSSKLRGERATAKAERMAPADVRGKAVRGITEPAIVELAGAGVLGGERFELELSGGRRLMIPAGFDADALSRLLAVLE
jgi:hypothetical protein